MSWKEGRVDQGEPLSIIDSEDAATEPPDHRRTQRLEVGLGLE